MAFSSPRRPSSTGREHHSSNRLDLDGRQGIAQIVWRAGVLDQVRSFSCQHYLSRSGTGQEVGGVFFGQKLGELLHVMAWRPIYRSASSVSRFELNGEEESRLRRLLSDTEDDSALRGMNVIGWFRSKNRGESSLEHQDARFHTDFFPDAASFALILKPSHQRPTLGAVFLRIDDEPLDPDAPAATLTLQPGPVAVNGATAQPLRPDIYIDRNPSPAAPPVNWKPLAAMAATALLLIVATVLALQWSQSRTQYASNANALGLHVNVEGTMLTASWNPQSPALQSAATGSLQIDKEQIALSRDKLDRGSATVQLKSKRRGDLLVTLAIGSIVESSHVIIVPH